MTDTPEKPVTLQVRRKEGCEDLPLPRYETEGSAGMDVRAAVEEDLTIQPGRVALVPTGLFTAVPPGYEIQVRPRSGLALKSMISVLNAPGTIDSDYRNEVGIILANFGEEPFTVTRGMRVAQLVVARCPQAQVVEVEELSETARGLGGFGSTGLH
jgi:dUTP pyrophosphatase